MAKRRFYFFVVALVCVLTLIVAGSKTVLAKPQAVKEIAISSYGVGSLAYICAVGIGEALHKVAGIRTIVVPAGNDVGRILPLRAGEVAFTSVTGATGWFVTHGTADFAAPEWGPQPLRIAWRGSTLFVGYFTRGDSGIKELSDLKGKRVSLVPGSPTINNLHKGVLAFAGLTLDDCKVRQFPSLGASARAVTQNFTDMSVFGTTGSLPRECAGSVHGIHWFNLDPKDEAGWERLWELAPWVDKGLATRYAGKEKGIKPFYTTIYPLNFWCWAKTPVDTAYAYAKAIWDSYDVYKGTHPELLFWDHKNAVNASGCYYPYHEGLIRLLKEKNVWTSELEKFQQTQLNNEAKRMKLWKEAKKEAKAKKIKLGSDKWKEYWWNKLKEARLLK